MSETRPRGTITSTRILINDVARDIVIAEGLGQLTTRGITAAAGIALGSFHQAYATKDELVNRLFDDLVAPADWLEFTRTVKSGQALASLELMVREMRNARAATRPRPTNESRHG